MKLASVTTMAGSRVPAALRNRLSDDGTFGLIELLDAERKDWSDQVLTVAAYPAVDEIVRAAIPQ